MEKKHNMVIHSNIHPLDIINNINPNIENGGILCGKKHSNYYEIIDYSILNPIFQSKNEIYLSNTSIILGKKFCKGMDMIGSWHNHPNFVSYPSDMDRRTSKNLNEIGCVITDKMYCYKNNDDIPVYINSLKPF